MGVRLTLVVLCLPVLSAVATDVDSLCAQNNSILVTPSTSPELISNTGRCDYDNHTCTSLQSAVNYVLSVRERTVICLHGNSTEFITDRTYFGNTSLLVVGINPLNVVCTYYSSLAQDVAENSDFWYFNQSDTVLFVNVHFRECPYPIRIAGVRTVLIQNSSFRFFQEAVLDLFNCESVSLCRVLFDSNIGTGTFLHPFRGNTGALALSYQGYSAYNYQPPRAQLHHCQFTNNSAFATSSFLTSEQALSRSIFTGRGGSMAIYINEHVKDVSIEIKDSAVVNSFARSYGGGVFVIINGHLPTQHKINFIKSNISSNYGQLAGSGVFLGFFSATNTVNKPHSVVFSESKFINNTGLSGGGIYIITSFVGSRGNYFRFERCNFTGNKGVGSTDEFGAAIGVALFTIFEQRVAAVQHDIVSCIFSSNSGGNGIVSVGYAPVRFSGSNLFVGNTGAPLRIIGSLVDFDDNISFVNNVVFSEGALSLLSFGQIRVHPGLSLNFVGNSGRVGASIVVSTPDSLTGFARIIGNPQCFILYQNSTVAPFLWQEVTITASQNSALLGSGLYLSQLDSCSWSSNSSPYFDKLSIDRWPLWKFGNNTNTGYSDSNNRDHYIATSAKEILARMSIIEAWPGKLFPMSIVGVDEFGQFSSTNAQFVQTLNNSLRFTPQISVIAGSFGSGLLTDEFQVQYLSPEENAMLPLNTTVTIDEPFETLPISSGQFKLVPEQCPGGYKLTPQREITGSNGSEYKICSCLSISEVITCEPNQDSVIVKDGVWVGYAPGQSPNLYFHPCPFGYCQCTRNSSIGPERCVYMYTHSNRDLQCTALRQGLLCGSCRNKSGVSVLLDRCVSCSNGFISLAVVLVVLDAVVFTIIILLDRPTTQWIYHSYSTSSCTSQMAPYLSRHFPESFTIPGVYMTYISNAVGFYFAYDFCLLENLPPIASYALRYIPSVIALTALSLVLTTRKLFHKRKSLRYHGCWLILLFLYPQLIHTSLTFLNCPQLADSSGTVSPRWFVDANVQCFTGWHIPLALLAIFILLLNVVTVIAFFVFSYKFQKSALIEKILAVVEAVYSEEVQWWPGVELGRRILLITLLLIFPLNTVYLMLLVVGLLSATAFFLPYKSFTSNLADIFLLLNMELLLLLDATPLIKESLFTFGNRVEVSPISWVLFLFYYLPILILVGAVVVAFVSKILNSCKKGQQAGANERSIVDFDASLIKNQQPVTSHTLDITKLQYDECGANLPISVL